MVVEGLDDAETTLLERIRAVIGPDVVVSASMDLHGNVSRGLAHQCDLITCYRLAPHEDALETKERAVRNLVDVLTTRPVGAQRPVMAWIPVPVLLPGEKTSTRIEPAASVYGQVAEVESTDGVLDAAIWVGYAWADQPRNRAVTVVTGWDEDAVRAGAERLARSFWDAREDFAFVAPAGSFDECLAAALAPGAARPYFVSDSGDNPTAGGSGDMTWGLTQLLARDEFRSADGPVVLYASVPGPAAVAACVAAGVGATVTVTAGAEVDDLHAGPLTMTGRVHAVKTGDRDARTEVVLQVGSVFAILTELRKPYHHEHDFTDLDLDPRSADLVVVKIGYLEPEALRHGRRLDARADPGRCRPGPRTPRPPPDRTAGVPLRPDLPGARPDRPGHPGVRPTPRSPRMTGRSTSPSLEIAVTSATGAATALAGGADRVELCSALEPAASPRRRGSSRPPSPPGCPCTSWSAAVRAASCTTGTNST